MPGEYAFILTENKVDYSCLIAFAKQHFPHVEICQSLHAAGVYMKDVSPDSGRQDGLPALFLIEAQLLEKAPGSLFSALCAQNCIFISFGYGKAPVCANGCHTTDHMDLTVFDANLAEQRLTVLLNLKKQLSSLQNEVRSFYEIGKSLSAEKDTFRLFEMILDSSMTLTSSDAGTLFLVVDSRTMAWSSLKETEPGNRLLQFAIAKNQSKAVNLASYVTPVTRTSISGYTAITGKPLRIDDVYSIGHGTDYSHNRDFDKNTGYRTKSMLSIPMKDHENNITGVIQLINKKINKNKPLDFDDRNFLKEIKAYDPADELIMNSLAGQAAVALENNLLYRDLNSLIDEYKIQNAELAALSRKILKAHEEERKRIAREIHDGPAQSMVNISLNLEICKRFLQQDSKDQLIAGLEKVIGSTRSTTRELRTIMYDLKPSYLEDGLISAIRSRLTILRDDTGLEIEFTCTGDDSKIEYYLSSSLYRIVQETLSNILKHAGAKHVKVSFDIGVRNMVLVVSDDGRGFVTNRPGKSTRSREGGFGLEGIRERVELISGKLNITSAPGKGTRIEVIVPV